MFPDQRLLEYKEYNMEMGDMFIHHLDDIHFHLKVKEDIRLKKEGSINKRMATVKASKDGEETSEKTNEKKEYVDNETESLPMKYKKIK